MKNALSLLNQVHPMSIRGRKSELQKHVKLLETKPFKF